MAVGSSYPMGTWQVEGQHRSVVHGPDAEAHRRGAAQSAPEPSPARAAVTRSPRSRGDVGGQHGDHEDSARHDNRTERPSPGWSHGVILRAQLIRIGGVARVRAAWPSLALACEQPGACARRAPSVAHAAAIDLLAAGAMSCRCQQPMRRSRDNLQPPHQWGYW